MVVTEWYLFLIGRDVPRSTQVHSASRF